MLPLFLFLFCFNCRENLKIKPHSFPFNPRGPCLPGRVRVETQGPQGQGSNGHCQAPGSLTGPWDAGEVQWLCSQLYSASKGQLQASRWPKPLVRPCPLGAWRWCTWGHPAPGSQSLMVLNPLWWLPRPWGKGRGRDDCWRLTEKPDPWDPQGELLGVSNLSSCPRRQETPTPRGYRAAVPPHPSPQGH